MKKLNNKLKNKIKSEKGAVTALVAATVFAFVAILTGTFVTIMVLRQSQYNSNGRIQRVYASDVNMVDEIYAEIEEKLDLQDATVPETPEKSEETAFDRSNGVIEVKFLAGTGYTVTDTPNEPNMAPDMKKVYWEDDGTEVTEGDAEFDEAKWYNYSAQSGDTASGGTSKWANAKTSDGSYWVWIPRYAYRIIYFDTVEHENAYRTSGATEGIIGYSDARGLVHVDGTTPSDMEEPVKSLGVGVKNLRPHPAFEDGSETGYTQGEWNENIEGLWIAKYEASGSTEALKSEPGVQALTSTTIGDMYTAARDYDEQKNSHMLKNSEWGAMAYLTESKYGRNGTAVSKNSKLNTAGASGATASSNPLQSTTGNYYGIYDTAGGAWEYTVAYIADSSTNSGNSFASIDNTYNNKTDSTGYATVYNMAATGASATREENYEANTNKKFGDGTVEISTQGSGSTSWNSNVSSFVGFNSNSHWPFFTRGGYYKDSVTTPLCFGYWDGEGDREGSFRVCLAVPTNLKEPAQSPEPESGGTSFATTYGVIEVKFMKDDTYYTSYTANDPKVDEANGMKLVKFDAATSEWVEGTEYSYIEGTGTADNTSSKWANAKVTVDGIDSYFVWIPRYAYKITYFDTPDHRDAYRADKTQTEGIVGYSDSRGMVDASGKKIDGVASSTSIDVGDYYMVHPAFTADASVGGGFGEIEGLWIGKYEASRSNATVTDAGSTTTLKVVPSVISWRNVTIGNMYTYAKEYNTNLNSHMLKSSEWGAVAYLTDSKYGRNGNEMGVNQCSSWITGAGPGKGDSNIYNTEYAYNASNFETEYSYTTTQGQKASTTGNVYGIYDISGGAWEYLASYYNASTYKDSNNKSYYELNGSSFASSEGTSDEYSTVYTGTSLSSNYMKGDATYETSNWNLDDTGFVTSGNPFAMRGGRYINTYYCGPFGYWMSKGAEYVNDSFRACLVVK